MVIEMTIQILKYIFFWQTENTTDYPCCRYLCTKQLSPIDAGACFLGCESHKLTVISTSEVTWK